MIYLLATLPPLILFIAVSRYGGADRFLLRKRLKLFLAGGAFVTAAALAIGMLFDALGLSNGAGGAGRMLFREFVLAAFVEEGLKYLVLRRTMRKEKRIRTWTETAVLSVAVTMGFAFFENLIYTLGETVYSLLARTVLSVPGHLAHAVLMGYFLGEAEHCRAEGDLPGEKRNRRRALLIPVLTHGSYDLVAELYKRTDSIWLIFLLFAYVIVLLVTALRLLKRMKKTDRLLSPQTRSLHQTPAGHQTEQRS